MNVGALSLRSSILIALCFQNAGYSLLRKYIVQSEYVSFNQVLLVAELMKMVFVSYVIASSTEISDSPSERVQKFQWLVKNSGKMLILAAIYGAMNILSFVALRYIGAGEFTICAQLKILATAGFSVIILGTYVSWTKWRALALLVIGCISVASPVFDSKAAHQADNPLHLQMLGYIAVISEVLLSGFASIYFEKVVKSTTEVVTIWERNFQLGIYSVVLYAGCMAYEGRPILEGWTWLTVIVSILGATGGLLVAATLKYANSILKSFAASGAIVLATVLGHYFFNGPLDITTIVGGACVAIALANYTFDTAEAKSTEPK